MLYKILAISLVFILGLGTGYKLFNKPAQPPAASVKIDDNSKEKKSGIKIVYMPSKCDGKPQEIATIEKYESDSEKDIKSDSVIELSDNFMAETDFRSEVGIKYRPFDNIILLNKAWIGPEYNFQHNEFKLKAAFTTRLNL